VHDFRRLQVWQRSQELFVAVDGLTRSFPRADRGVLAGQLRRAALSIAANIAEGCGKSAPKEMLRFLEIAAGSATEAESHLLLATDLGYIHRKQSEAMLEEITVIRRMLFRLRGSLSSRPPSPNS
jgi:four helix bundle protein